MGDGLVIWSLIPRGPIGCFPPIELSSWKNRLLEIFYSYLSNSATVEEVHAMGGAHNGKVVQFMP
jgi:hypothetical protein